eukprot:ctg_630.g261
MDVGGDRRGVAEAAAQGGDSGGGARARAVDGVRRLYHGDDAGGRQWVVQEDEEGVEVGDGVRYCRAHRACHSFRRRCRLAIASGGGADPTGGGGGGRQAVVVGAGTPVHGPRGGRPDRAGRMMSGVEPARSRQHRSPLRCLRRRATHLPGHGVDRGWRPVRPRHRAHAVSGERRHRLRVEHLPRAATLPRPSGAAPRRETGQFVFLVAGTARAAQADRLWSGVPAPGCAGVAGGAEHRRGAVALVFRQLRCLDGLPMRHAHVRGARDRARLAVRLSRGHLERRRGAVHPAHRVRAVRCRQRKPPVASNRLQSGTVRAAAAGRRQCRRPGVHAASAAQGSATTPQRRRGVGASVAHRPRRTTHQLTDRTQRAAASASVEGA